MSKALKVIGTIAGAVALIGTAALTFGGSAFAATALGGALGGTGGIAAVAGVATLLVAGFAPLPALVALALLALALVGSRRVLAGARRLVG